MATETQYRYEMNLKKDALFINLTSDDVTFISRQMDQWFRILLDDSYIPTPAPAKRLDAPPIAAEAPAVAAVNTPLPAPALETPAVPVIPITPESPVAVTPVNSPASETIPSVPAAVTPQPQPPLPAAQAPIATETPVQQAVPVLQPPPPAVETLVVAPLPVAPSTRAPIPAAPVTNVPIEPPQDSFDAVMDSVMRDLETSNVNNEKAFLIEEPVAFETAPTNLAPMAMSAEAILPPAPALPGPAQPTMDPFASLDALCRYSRAVDVQDFLLLSALYLTRSEQAETFSLKRLNSALVKAGKTPVNHSALEAALGRGVLAMVPDLSGNADVSEYELTPAGTQAANELIAR